MEALWARDVVLNLCQQLGIMVSHSLPNFCLTGSKVSLPGEAFWVVSPLSIFWCQGVGFVCTPSNWNSVVSGTSRTSLPWFLGLRKSSRTSCGGSTLTTFFRGSPWRSSALTYTSSPTPRITGGAPICRTNSSRAVDR